jgi:ferritin-like metal-binding protein YciE
MKLEFKDLNEVLTYHIEGLYDAEKTLQKKISDLLTSVTSPELKSILLKFLENRADTRIKLKRIFSYLLSGPFKRRDKVINQMLIEATAISKITI